MEKITAESLNEFMQMDSIPQGERLDESFKDLVSKVSKTIKKSVSTKLELWDALDKTNTEDVIEFATSLIKDEEARGKVKEFLSGKDINKIVKWLDKTPKGVKFNGFPLVSDEGKLLWQTIKTVGKGKHLNSN